MARAVRYEEFGDVDVLHLSEVDPPEAGPGQIRVHVRVAGLNPVDYKIFHGPAAEQYGAQPPCGVGHDFSGVVDQVGAGVTAFAPGDAVLGGARNKALADYAVLDLPGLVIPKPEGLSFEAAGALAVAGRTAWASVASLALTGEDTVLVSAAAGGVGVLAAQLAVRAGATVVGTAGEGNHDFLRSLGVIPVSYGDGLVDRLRKATPRPFTAVLDNHGAETIRAGLELGVSPARINTIADRPFAADVGGTGVGAAEASMADFAAIAALLADDELVLPIDSVFPLERFADAYRRLEAGHLLGKIVLTTD